MKTTFVDYLKLHFIVFLFGFTAILGKLISLPSVEMVFYRTLLASAAGMGALILFTKGTFALPSQKDFWKLILTGLVVAAHWLTFFGSGRVANPSVSLVGFATCSFWAALIEPIAKQKKIQPMEVGLGLAVLIGLYVIFSFEFHYALGLLLGIASGLTAAIFSVINSKLVTRISSYTITFYEMAAACLGLIAFFPFYKTFFSDGPLHLIPSALDWVIPRPPRLGLFCVCILTDDRSKQKTFCIFYSTGSELRTGLWNWSCAVNFWKTRSDGLEFLYRNVDYFKCGCRIPNLVKKKNHSAFHFNSPLQ